MEELNFRKNFKKIWDKYRYVLLIVLLGLGLMMIPSQSNPSAPVDAAQTEPVIAESLESQLEKILSHIDGAGRVEVLLTEHTGSETSFQTNVSSDTQSENTRQTSDTVIIEDASRQEHGLVRRVDAPVYRGAIVACQGAGSAQVRLAIVEAVQCVTNLRADQISVVKMK